MRISRITIKSIMGLDALEIDAQGRTVSIEASNGKGKTSILSAIRSVLGGGHDATLLRKGAKQGEIVLVLDDGEIITKTITAEKSALKLDHPEWGKVSKPQQIIDKLIGPTALNPITILTAKSKDLTALVLSSMPLRIPSEEIAVLTGNPEHVKSYRFPCSDRHALDVLGEVEQGEFEQRTGVNRALKEKKATIEQLSGTVPAAPEGAADWKAQLDDLEAEQADTQATDSAVLAASKASTEKARNEAKARHAERLRETTLAQATEVAEVNFWQTVEIDKIKTEAQTRLGAIRAHWDGEAGSSQNVMQTTIAELDTNSHAMIDSMMVAQEGSRAALSERIGTAKAQVEAEAKATQTRAIISDMERQADKLDTEAKRLTAAIEALRAKKLSLAATLPIRGMEIVDGETYVDGIPWERVNESARIRMAVELSALQLGKLRVVVLDGAEALDSASRKMLFDELDAHDVQGFVTVVTDQKELTATTDLIHAAEARAEGISPLVTA